MLIFSNAVFLHVPKTGGTWVREACRAAGASFSEYLVDNDLHGDLSYCPCPERFKFAFVRHPCDLYSSYWRFKMVEGWDPLNPFDMDCHADTFEGFVRKVLSVYPGWCSRMFEDYVGRPASEIQFIGRFERLADDLVLALCEAGESFDEAPLRALPARNVSTWPGGRSAWTRALASAIHESERDAFARFHYSLDVWSPT